MHHYHHHDPDYPHHHPHDAEDDHENNVEVPSSDSNSDEDDVPRHRHQAVRTSMVNEKGGDNRFEEDERDEAILQSWEDTKALPDHPHASQDEDRARQGAQWQTNDGGTEAGERILICTKVTHTLF